MKAGTNLASAPSPPAWIRLIGGLRGPHNGDPSWETENYHVM